MLFVQTITVMTSGFFRGQDTIYVHTWGKGKLHLLSFDPVVSQLEPVVGGKSTPNDVGPTNYVVGFSHYYRQFAFHWEGPGEAHLRVGTQPDLIPIGKSWEEATLAPYGGTSLSTADVRSTVSGAIVREEATTVFVVPSY